MRTRKCSISFGPSFFAGILLLLDIQLTPLWEKGMCDPTHRRGETRNPNLMMAKVYVALFP